MYFHKQQVKNKYKNGEGNLTIHILKNDRFYKLTAAGIRIS